MTPSKLLLPYDGDTVEAGDVKFRWVTAEAPEKLMPDFMIVQAADTRILHSLTASLMNAGLWKYHATGILIPSLMIFQVASGMNLILPATKMRLKLNYIRTRKKCSLYSDTGKYYWRVKWMNAPDNPGDNSFYATSDTFLFIIVAGGGGRPSDLSPKQILRVAASVYVPLLRLLTVHPNRRCLTGESLLIGNFTLNVTSLTSSGGSRFTGKGLFKSLS